MMQGQTHTYAKSRKNGEAVLSSEESSEEEGKVYIPRFIDDQSDDTEELISEVADQAKERRVSKGKTVMEEHILHPLVDNVVVAPVQCLPSDEHKLPECWEDNITAEDLNLAIIPITLPDDKYLLATDSGCFDKELLKSSEVQEGVFEEGGAKGEFKVVKKKGKKVGVPPLAQRQSSRIKRDGVPIYMKAQQRMDQKNDISV
ncbi:hypothetical protein ABZP36_025129 [Zizania latifolia]